MSTSLANNDGNTELDTRGESNNCSSVNKNDVEVIMPPPELHHLERRKKIRLWYGIILLNALNIMMMIYMLNAIIVMRCIHVIQEGMKIQL